MNNPEAAPDHSNPFSREEIQSALFAQMVTQHSNMAMLLLGKVPDPHSGQTVRDLEAARLFIDQLEMLEVKTKGNLTREEGSLLKQNLMTLRLAFVEAVESPAPAGRPVEKAAAPATPPSPPASPEATTAPTESAGAAGEEESRKRYSKKFSL